LAEVCEALDDPPMKERARMPKSWSPERESGHKDEHKANPKKAKRKEAEREYRSWTEACVPERSLVIKTIKYWLGVHDRYNVPPKTLV
jgi:hypothetical protein